MAFKYGCFVSYVHAAQGGSMNAFTDSLIEALVSELEPYVDQPVYVDRDRHQGGTRYPSAIADGLCSSACWIMVYVPQYAKHPECMREFQAMTELEAKRRLDLGKEIAPEQGMIIPVLFRGKSSELPNGLAKHVHYLDFKRYSIANRRISKNSKYMDQIMDLAKYVFEIYKLGERLNHDCGEFALPDPAPTSSFRLAKPGFPGDPVEDEVER